MMTSTAENILVFPFSLVFLYMETPRGNGYVRRMCRGDGRREVARTRWLGEGKGGRVPVAKDRS
jgi:hypothetical protein